MGWTSCAQALDELVARLPAGDPSAPVRLWVDRGFTIRGAGLVVTGTLAAGTVRVGDTLELARTGARFVVREMQSLNQHVNEATGVARVALNLRGPARRDRPRRRADDARQLPLHRRRRRADPAVRSGRPAAGSCWCTLAPPPWSAGCARSAPTRPG